MARPRQKKKQRSSRSSVKTGQAGRTKAGKKKVNFLGNEIIAKNWDHKLTLAQNYERLGLSVRLNNRTGGVEKKIKPGSASGNDNEHDSLHILPGGGARAGQLIPSEVEVERDPETGAILRILGEEDEDPTANPLNDPLAALDDDVEDAMNIDPRPRHNTHAVVQQLEAQAAAEAEELDQKKRPRQQSAREEEWIKALVEKHGDDYAAMFRDKKLNIRQQSEGDIKKRIKKWKAAHG